MVKKFIWAMIIISLVVACAKKEQEVADEVLEARFYLTYLPSFEQTFASLDFLEVSDFDSALQMESYSVMPDVYRRAFALGVLSADAVIAVKARNQAVLQDITTSMIDYSRFLGISQDILMLADELSELVENNQWMELKQSLDKYKESVELSLYEKREYDLFTLLQLGGWTEGLNSITFLLMNNYDEKSTEIIDQKGILNNLINNLENIEAETVLEQNYYEISLNNYLKIRDIIYNETGTYDLEEISNIYKLTYEIKQAFLQ